VYQGGGDGPSLLSTNDSTILLVSNSAPTQTNYWRQYAGVASPVFRHVTSEYLNGGRVFISSTSPTAIANGDIWIQI
jgi:hypothetical protein